MQRGVFFEGKICAKGRLPATAFASMVFPVPGGPVSSAPFMKKNEQKKEKKSLIK